jgi:hypothetical protein
LLDDIAKAKELNYQTKADLISVQASLSQGIFTPMPSQSNVKKKKKKNEKMKKKKEKKRKEKNNIIQN